MWEGRAPPHLPSAESLTDPPTEPQTRAADAAATSTSIDNQKVGSQFLKKASSDQNNADLAPQNDQAPPSNPAPQEVN